MATAQVPCSTILAAVVLHVAPTSAQLLGGVLVIAAVGILQARPMPQRWRRRLLAPAAAVPGMRGRVERSAPERRPDRGLPLRRPPRHLSKPLAIASRRIRG
jgi:hypothetical protein